jgi:hypothetical protein
MKNYKSNSGTNIVYIDHSTSGMGASINQSTADPLSLANIIRQPIIITNKIPPRLGTPYLKPADKYERLEK